MAFDDLERLTALLADAAPVHVPGAGVAEHALTYGHLCDALVRRATGDDLADRFATIARQHGWDVHLRVAPGDLGRVADVVPLEGWPEVYADDPRGVQPSPSHPGCSTPTCSTPSGSAAAASLRSPCTRAPAGWPASTPT